MDALVGQVSMLETARYLRKFVLYFREDNKERISHVPRTVSIISRSFATKRAVCTHVCRIASDTNAPQMNTKRIFIRYDREEFCSPRASRRARGSIYRYFNYKEPNDSRANLKSNNEGINKDGRN